MATTRTVNCVRLAKQGDGVWRSVDGLFDFMREDSPTRLGPTGWCVRARVGDFADPDGQYEPLVLDNGLTWAATLRETVALAYRLKWHWLRNGTITREQLGA